MGAAIKNEPIFNRLGTCTTSQTTSAPTENQFSGGKGLLKRNDYTELFVSRFTFAGRSVERPFPLLFPNFH